MITLTFSTLDDLAEMLYCLNFPRREFKKLPESVQDGYRMDAARLVKMAKGEA